MGPLPFSFTPSVGMRLRLVQLGLLVCSVVAQCRIRKGHPKSPQDARRRRGERALGTGVMLSSSGMIDNFAMLQRCPLSRCTPLTREPLWRRDAARSAAAAASSPGGSARLSNESSASGVPLSSEYSSWKTTLGAFERRRMLAPPMPPRDGIRRSPPTRSVPEGRRRPEHGTTNAPPRRRV